ncbi:MAG TPA: DegT/DnrJ/EryC1/StrS family aminotransferase [Sandaracinaceae bacterium LLY-WYZ-13_1]|nr:DegT/DnrJ/EryC1/StrS family aminotransferase [Sandaracinaceae bacterium LLY-WYZ-13_1]
MAERDVVRAPAKVPQLDLRRGGPDLDAELVAAFRRVLESGRYILGPEVEAFERECAGYVGAAHAIGVSSGTDALLVALMALDVGPGDEVICPTYTFFATAGAIWRLGATPVFVDSQPRCFGLDPAQLAERRTARTKAIVPVHLFGQCAAMDALREAAGEVPIVEDAAQALGASWRGTMAGALGTLGCFSFFPSKNLGGFGDGGLVTTDDDALAARVRRLRVHGAEPKYVHAEVGGNFRLDALQAALLRVKLPRLEDAIHRRRAHAWAYAEAFVQLGIGAPAPGPGCRTACGVADPTDAPVLLPTACDQGHSFNQYVVRIPGRRDAVRARLAEQGIGTAVYYPTPLHAQACFAPLGHAPGDFPVAERLAEESLALPIFPELGAHERDRVVEAIGDALRDGR